MEKSWWQSKAKISGLVIAVGSLLLMAGEALETGTFDFNMAFTLFVGTGIFGIRDAQN